MAQSIDDISAPIDPDQGIKDFFSLLALLTGADTEQLEPGDLVYDLTDTVVRWFADQWNTWIVPGIQSQFLEFAEGAWLSYRAWSSENRPREASTFAVGDIVVENRGVGVGTIAAGTLRVKSASAATFVNTSAAFMPLWIGSGPYPTVMLTMRADIAGSSSNTLASALPVYPTPVAAAPFGSLYVQSNAALLGSDEEPDVLLRRRCQLAAAERGQTPREYIEAVARDPIGALRRANIPIPSTWPPTVNVTRVRLVEPGNGLIRVYLASKGGTAAGSTSVVDSDVYICDFALQLLAVPPGGSLVTAPAVEVPIAYGIFTLTVAREMNVPKATAETTAGVALAAFFSMHPVGGERLVAGGQGYALIEHVYGVAGAGKGVLDVVASGVHVDVALAPNEVAVPTYTIVAGVVAQGTG